MITLGRGRTIAVLAAIAGAVSGWIAASPAAAAVTEIPVAFTVKNTNTTPVACAADGKTYTVSGHIVGPSDRLAADGPKAGALYVHGLGYGEFFWHDTTLPNYDYARLQAQDAGLISVVIDRLGYGASGRPDGKLVCYGSEADYLHQIIQQLRAGTYRTGEGAAPVFNRVALVGHSAGGFMVEVEASTYHDIDALATVGFSNTGAGPITLLTFAQATLDCALNPLPGNYAYFGKTDNQFRLGHFGSASADPAVVASVVARRAPDPCQDTGSAIPAIVVDLLKNSTISVPVLLVTGAKDNLFPPPAGTEEQLLFPRTPDLTQTTLADTPHAMTFGLSAPVFRATMATWLKNRGF